MNVLALNITDKIYNYGIFILEAGNVENDGEKIKIQSKNCVKTKKRAKKVQLDSAFVNYLIREILISKFYRVHFIEKWTIGSITTFTLILKSTEYDLIDYNW